MAQAKKDLVIVESPAKARTIEKYLGGDYKVIASMGHLRDLPKSKLGVDIEHGFTPEYIPVAARSDVINELKKRSKEAGTVYLATDPDREGEAISWHLKELLKIPDEKARRVTFNEITKKVVQESIANPRDIDQDLVDAQQARRILDRIVGYKLSPLLWRKVRRGLSAGRVQSVAIRMVVDRENEIRAFQPEEYWYLDAHLDRAGKKGGFVARYYGTADKKKELHSEIEKIAIMDELPINWTYPEIQPKLLEEARKRGFLPKKEEIKWLFFDVGSTLVDESKVYEDRMKRIADLSGLTYEQINKYAMSFYKENKKGDLEVARQLGVKLPKWESQYERLYTDTKDCLKKLSRIYKIGVIANQSLGTSERLENFGVRKYIDLIIASAEEGVSKPDRRIFEIALERSCCKPENAVMIGDRIDNDIVPAKQLGMKTIWVKQEFGSLWNITDESEKADIEVNNLSDILNFL